MGGDKKRRRASTDINATVDVNCQHKTAGTFICEKYAFS